MRSRFRRSRSIGQAVKSPEPANSAGPESATPSPQSVTLPGALNGCKTETRRCGGRARPCSPLTATPSRSPERRPFPAGARPARPPPRHSRHSRNSPSLPPLPTRNSQETAKTERGETLRPRTSTSQTSQDHASPVARASLKFLFCPIRSSENMTSINTANINFKWDPKSLEIRTLAVERLLEPLVTQVTTLVNSSNKGPSNKKKGRSKKAHVLAASVETATENFLEKGEKIAKESQFLKEELTAAVEDVRKQGESMRLASGEFAEDPCSSVKRGNMVRAARALLSAVTHLLVLADMADVYQLLLQLKLVEENLMKVRNAGTEQDLGIQYKALKPEVDKLNMMAAKRQQELKDVHHKDQMAAARGVLQRNIPMLYTASRACLQHPDVAAYKANRDLIYKQLQHAVSGISNAAQATSSEDSTFTHPAGGGELAGALNNFDKQIIVDPLNFSEERFRPSLEERLESIISGAALMADSSCTRDDRRERIVAECNSVRQALQDLLTEYMGNAGRKDKSDALNMAIDRMTKKTRDLRRQLRKAVMDHVSDSFLETNVPLLVLIEAAKNGNEKEVKEYAQVFREHANKLIEVANLACSISNNEEGVKLVRMAASQLETLCPQVINAALALAAKPNSKVAQDNMDLFKEQWEKQVRVLTDAVDDITSIDDFLSVSENHILEDVNKCVIALQEKDVDGLDRTAGAIRGRAARVVHVVTSEMDNYEPGVYTEKVLEATKLLTETVMPRFTEQVEAAVEALSANPSQPVDENEFIDASRLVYDGVRDIRKAVLMIRTPEELDDSDFETEDFDSRSRTSVQTEDDQLIAGQSARQQMRVGKNVVPSLQINLDYSSDLVLKELLRLLSESVLFVSCGSWLSRVSDRTLWSQRVSVLRRCTSEELMCTLPPRELPVTRL
ncbi:hypothetical protein AOLI_G00187010 [Acnodon oligacanthus]